jgi:inner membrane protein
MPGLAGAQGQRPLRAGREAGIDPVCHTLVGAGLARSGLARRTAFATSTLLIGANLPDVDVLAYLWGPGADLAFRRGWTHGVLALALWPLALSGAMLLLDRALRRLSRASLPSGVRPGQLLLLSCISIWSHSALDTLNTYGVRWLMPFSGRWFYGDTLFIVDPWVWLALGLGVLLSRLRMSTRPTRLALWLVLGYAAAMVGSAVAAQSIARAEMTAISGAPVRRVLVSPVPVNPFRRRVVAELDETYRTGAFRWLADPHVDPASVRLYPKGDRSDPRVARAASTTLGRRFLGWARFPAFRVEEAGGGRVIVHIVDLRYADRPGMGFGAVSIPLAGHFEVME